MKYFNGKAIIARQEATALTCAGYVFDSDNEKLKDFWEQWKHYNNFNDLLYTTIENNSIYGKTIYGIEKIGENIGVIAHNYLQTAEVSSDSVGNPQVVKINIPVNYDNKNYRIDRIYTADKVVSVLYDENGAKVQQNGKVYNLGTNVIQKQYSHNAGVVPVVMCYNLPYKTEFYNPQNMIIQYSGATDTVYSHSLFKYYFQSDTTYAEPTEALINKTLETFDVERIKSETLMVINGSSGNEFLSATNSTMDDEHKNIFLNHGFIVNVNDRGAQISFKPNQNKLTEILSCVDDLIAYYYSLCNLSYPTFSGGNNKHSAEIKTAMINSIQTHKTKKNNIEKWVKELFYKSALMNGFSPDDAKDFFFQLNELSLDDTLSTTQALTTAKQAGIIDTKTAVIKYLGISSEKADEIVELINEQQKAEQAQMAANNPNASGKGVSDTNK